MVAYQFIPLSLGAQQIKEFGFPKELERYFSIYDKYASPTFESIHLFNSGALREIQNLLHKTLLNLISSSADGKKFVRQFLSEIKGRNLDKGRQISFLQKIIDTNNLR